MRLSLPLILASASPRRASLLKQIGLPFRALASNFEEPPPHAGEDIMAWAKKAALEKVFACAAMLPDDPALVLGADTVVLLPDNDYPGAPLLNNQPVQVLGKPLSAEDAFRMLHQLSGRTHSVISAFALYDHPGGTTITEAVETTVTFRTLSDEEIDSYIQSGEPLDKAGAYGIQGQGAILIERIDGDYYTVVGLPLTRLWERLASWRDGGR